MAKKPKDTEIRRALAALEPLDESNFHSGERIHLRVEYPFDPPIAADTCGVVLSVHEPMVAVKFDNDVVRRRLVLSRDIAAGCPGG